MFGVPHKITAPNLEYMLYEPSSDRLTWTIKLCAPGPTCTSPLRTSTVVLNQNGSTRSTTDADGICTTFEYAPNGLLTKIRRATSGCGVVPIDEGTGEVEVRSYQAGEANRLNHVARRTNGNLELEYSRFVYDSDRRLVSAATIDSSTPFTFGYTDLLPSSTVAPGAPSAASWRTDTTADDFGRPTSILRFLDATNKQTSTLGYATSMTPRPTTLTRGYNGSSTAVTTFVYDDFGRLVQSTVPEAGAPGSPAPTRYEYDVADRMIKKRVGVGTALVRTSVYSYDALGRTTFVDHDTEHPVDCASAAEGTPIQDEEYKYDSCAGDAPSAFSCTNALGRLAVARTILRCSGGEAIKHGRWHAWDAAGQLGSLAYATMTGSSIGTALTTGYNYTTAGRPSTFGSPLNTAFRTKYEYGGTPRVTTVKTSGSVMIASNIGYRAFGPVTQLDTQSIQPVSGGTRTLKLRTSYRSNNTLDTLDWTMFGSSGVSNINLLKPTITYNPAGLLQSKTDAADITSSRHYSYDALARLTCEARGSGTTQPSSSDCVTSSARLAGLYTYGNGESATSPPDVRLTAFIKGAGSSGASYTSPSTETYTYSNGSGQTQGITRTGSNIVIAYDALGRRTMDHDSADSVKSKRTYTYLPNGQLGMIDGRTQAGSRYTATVDYDTEGRPLTITMVAATTTTYELFWDDSDRLVAASINGGAVRWHYHHLGKTLLAATREIGANVKRFWAVTDERGLVYRMVDEVGATFWQARWDATGWRSIVGTPQSNMWVPFGLPGQIIVDGTRAFRGTSTTTVRGEVALNQWRSYDPLYGAFQQLDSADSFGRLNPKRYHYARSNFMSAFDPNGLKIEPFDRAAAAVVYRNALYFDSSCTSPERDNVAIAVAQAIRQIMNCTSGECGDTGVAGGPEHIRESWVNNLVLANYKCPKSNPEFGTTITLQGWFNVNDEGPAGAYVYPDVGNAMWVAPISLSDGFLRGWGHNCLANTVAHEALHLANANVPANVVYSHLPFTGSTRFYHTAMRASAEEASIDERAVRSTVGWQDYFKPNSIVKGCVACD